LDSVDVKWKYYTDENESISETVRTHNSLGVALGGGIDIEVNDNIAIRAIQADYFMASHPRDILPDYWHGYADTGNKRFNNLSLSFGIVFRFGR
jgi:outer membrane protein W